MGAYEIILASASPRRREILSMLRVPFTVVVANANEDSETRDPALLVQELALRKGDAVRARQRETGQMHENTLIIASDTVVAIDGEILGKPRDEEDARAMLRRLSGKAHKVTSGIALLTDTRAVTAYEETEVRFSVLTEAEIDRYVKSGEPMDKAGAYAVQGLASVWIEGLTGDYFNVVGLPVHRLDLLLREFVGVSLNELS
jgi:septum formation protein